MQSLHRPMGWFAALLLALVATAAAQDANIRQPIAEHEDFAQRLGHLVGREQQSVGPGVLSLACGHRWTSRQQELDEALRVALALPARNQPASQ